MRLQVWDVTEGWRLLHKCTVALGEEDSVWCTSIAALSAGRVAVSTEAGNLCVVRAHVAGSQPAPTGQSDVAEQPTCFYRHFEQCAASFFPLKCNTASTASALGLLGRLRCTAPSNGFARDLVPHIGCPVYVLGLLGSGENEAVCWGNA